MKTKLLGLFLLAGSTMFAGPRIFFGIGIGGGQRYYAPPPPPPAAYYAPPVAPGPGYAWVNGYYYPQGRDWRYRSGYWGRRPYPGAYWTAPRYDRGRYYGGYWRR